jgi:methyl-accepting chemotaxis protein
LTPKSGSKDITKMKNISIRTKLIGALSLLLAIVVSLGGVTVERLMAVDEVSDELAEKWIPSLDVVGSFRGRISELRIALGERLSAVGGEARELEQQMAGGQKRIGELLAEYEALITLFEEQALYDEFSRHWDAYLIQHQRVLETARSGRSHEAQDLFIHASKAAFDPMIEDLRELMDYITDGGHDAGARAHDIEESAALIVMITIAVSILLTALIGFALVRAITRPLGAMTAAMTKLAEGDLEVSVPALEKRDEIGAMAKAVQVFKEAAIEKRKLDQAAEAAGEEIARLVAAAAAGDLTQRIELSGKAGFFKTLSEGMNTLVGAVASAVNELAAMMAAMAQGDLSKRVSGDYEGAFLKLKQDANSTAEKLAEIASQTVEGMTNIKASTTEIATGATDLSARTEEQVASLEEIAASIRQLNTTVQQSSENAGQASQLALAARTAAESGGEVANSAVAAMGEIEQSSQRISDIVGMIDEIAFQTNLLALNAAVEAARAGEAGRGFAVVAGEVRALAQRSSQASKDIKSLIQNSSQQVKQGVELVNKAGATLAEIVTSVKRVSDIVAEIAAANKEQSASVGEVQEAIGQIEQATQQNAALVEETTAALGSADNQVQSVTEVVAFFKLDSSATPKPANAPAAAKGAKAVQARLANQLGAKTEPAPTQSSGARKLAATGTDDGWEEF